MSVYTQSSYTDFLFEIFDKRAMHELHYGNSMWLDMMARNEKWVGSTFHAQTLAYSPGANMGPNFSGAQDNGTNMGTARWEISTRKREYAVLQLDNQLIEAAIAGDGASVSLLQQEMSLKMAHLNARIAWHTLGNGYGALGQVSAVSAGASSTITMDHPNQVRLVQKGDRLVFAGTESGAYYTDGGASGVAVVTSVNREDGQFTVSTNTSTGYNSGTGIAADDWVFLEKDCYNNDSYKVLMGADAFVPSSVATTTLFTVDRSADSSLSGFRYDGSSVGAEEALVRGESRICELSGQPVDMIVINNRDLEEMKVALEDNARFDKVSLKGTSGEYTLSYHAISLAGSKGQKVILVPEPMQRRKVAHVFRRGIGGPLLITQGAMPKVLTQSRVVEDADATEFRVGGYGEFLVGNPMAAGRITLA